MPEALTRIPTQAEQMRYTTMAVMAMGMATLEKMVPCCWFIGSAFLGLGPCPFPDGEEPVRDKARR